VGFRPQPAGLRPGSSGTFDPARQGWIMARRRLVLRASAVVAAAVLALAAVPPAARGGGYRGGYYGGYHGGYYGGYRGYYGGYYHGYYGPYRGYYGPYRGFYGYYRGYGWGFYGGFGVYGYLPYPYYGIGVGVAVGYPGYLPYGVAAGAYYPATNVVVTPSAPPVDGQPPSSAAVPPEGSAGSPQGGAQPPPADGKARLLLLVPANAEVWFDGQPTSQAGTEREFASPVLTPNQVYTYSVRVRAPKDDGRVNDETRRIQVRANDRWLVDFTRPVPPPMPKASPEGPSLNPNPPPSR
jgi:uncharacterized protein (TIGR03000 family)